MDESMDSMSLNDEGRGSNGRAVAALSLLAGARPTRRAFVAGAACTVAACALAPAAFAEEAASGASDGPAAEIVIFHTNDTHGYLQGDGESTVGIDLVAGVRDATPNALLVDAGDATQGMPLASIDKGASVVSLMSAAGYQAMCLGNHEFDFGQDNLIANAGAATFPFLGANVLKDGAPLLAGVTNAAGETLDGCSTVLECAGRRIGVFGIATTATATSVNPAFVSDLEFADEIAALSAQGVDAIVALCHLGDGPVPCKAVDLAAGLSADAAAKLAAIVDGHSHTVENEEVNGVLVVQTGCNGANLGKLTLAFDEDGAVSASEELLDAAACTAIASASADVAADLEAVTADLNVLMGEVLFSNPTTLWAGWLSETEIAAPTRMVETNFGDVATDALRQAAQTWLRETAGDASTPVVALENGGGIRSALPRGEVNLGHLVTAFPFSNTVVLKTVTPAVLREVFEGGLALTAGQDAATGMLLQQTVAGSFLQLSGCTVTCDPNAEAGQRVQQIVLDGAAEPLDLADAETPIVLASNTYVMAGGDDYAALAGIEQLAEIGGELETIQGYLEELAGASDVASEDAAAVEGGAAGEGDTASEGGAAGSDSTAACLPLFAGTEGRLQLRGGYEPAPWTATLRLVGADGAPLADYGIALQVDGGDVVEVASDANGLVYLEVADGSHAVCEAPADPSIAMPEVYVDNYMGYGLVEDDLRTFPQIMVMGV